MLTLHKYFDARAEGWGRAGLLTILVRDGVWAFALGVILVTGGVLMHAPMFLMGRHNHFVLAGMPIGWDMVAGMAAIVGGCGIATDGSTGIIW